MPIFNTRTALIAGFGGLILLLVVSGVDAIQVLSQMRTGNEEIRREFLLRTKRLEKIRSALYLSGTYVRDYLLEPDPVAAEHHRDSLNAVRAQIDSELRSYGTLLRADQRGPFLILEQELDAYWRSMSPVLGWDARTRHEKGYAFVRDEVIPRRRNMLNIADRIAGVNENELAAGEARVNGMFGIFRKRLFLVLGVTLALGLLQAAATIRVILKLEREARRHLEQVTQARAELRELSAKLVEAQEAERKAISRELHDAIGQSLSAVLLELRNLTLTLPPGLTEHLDTVKKLVEGSVGMVRNMALLLRPSMLDDLGLIPALEWQGRDVSRRTGVVINIAAGDLPDHLTDDQKTCIFRVVQEALNNISKHAEAQTVRITVRAAGDEVLLSVQDDGRGFTLGKQKGLGLVGIQERVTNLGGTVQLDSQPGRGTLLAVTLPLRRNIEQLAAI